jgi:hypothetical protein
MRETAPSTVLTPRWPNAARTNRWSAMSTQVNGVWTFTLTALAQKRAPPTAVESVTLEISTDDGTRVFCRQDLNGWKPTQVKAGQRPAWLSTR